MKIFIIGIDGYLGWPLALHLRKRGHDVSGCDNGLRRQLVQEEGSDSAIPIADIYERARMLGESNIHYNDVMDYKETEAIIKEIMPDAIVHLGEIASAPYSMMSAKHCAFTNINNIVGTLNLLHIMRDICPEAHLLKLGTLGEYGTPNTDIPEGFGMMEYNGRKDVFAFPKAAGSFYHWTKVHDSNNVMFACKIWGLRATDIMQGPVYGTRIKAMGDDPKLCTRFDYDQVWGTVLNRLCAQAVVGHPLTVYGSGDQQRAFLSLEDSIQCMTLALEHPSEGYRVFNQFDKVYSIRELAEVVTSVADSLGLKTHRAKVENPRIEKEEHYYNPECKKLPELGYIPAMSIENTVAQILKDLLKHKDRINLDVLLPDIRWDGSRRQSKMEKL